MSESTTNQLLEKIYTERHILLSTFFLGPIAGLYFLYQNFITLGNQGGANKTIGLGLVGLILYLISSLTKFVSIFIYWFAPWLIMVLIVYKFQKSHIDEFLKNGGKRQNGRKAFGIAILCMIVLILIQLLMVSILQQLGLVSME